MGKRLEINPSEINDVQLEQLGIILEDSRTIFSADGQREFRDGDSSDTLSELVTSAPGGSFKRALEYSLEPGNLPLLRLYDRATAMIPGFKLATVNLEVSYRAIDRDIARNGRHGEVLILDKKTRYYEAIIRHQINREDPEQRLESNYEVPLEVLLTPFECRVTESFRYSDNPEGLIEHALGINASWYRAPGELNVDDSLHRLSMHLGYISRPAVAVVPEEAQQVDKSIPDSLSA